MAMATVGVKGLTSNEEDPSAQYRLRLIAKSSSIQKSRSITDNTVNTDMHKLMKKKSIHLLATFASSMFARIKLTYAAV